MAYSTSSLAYNDIRTLFEAVLTDGKKRRLTFETDGAAAHFVARANAFRKIERDRLKHIYPDPGNALHGTCPYDPLAVRRPGRGAIVMVEKMEVNAKVEELE